MATMWIDTHCHLDAPEFEADRDAVTHAVDVRDTTGDTVLLAVLGGDLVLAGHCDAVADAAGVRVDDWLRTLLGLAVQLGDGV